MNVNHFILKSGTGKNTFLDDKYSKFLAAILVSQDEYKIDRWEIYNLIIKELLTLKNGITLFSEIQYRLTDYEDPNTVLSDIIFRLDSSEINDMLWYLSRRVNEFALDDLEGRFIKIPS